LVVLVNGAPASGKSTLARLLAADLVLPLLAKDAIKEVLYDTLGAPDRARSRQLGGASYALVYAAISWLRQAGAGAVVDCNFQRGRAEANLAALLGGGCAVLVYCYTTPDEILRRYAERAARGERHPGHFDAEGLPDLAAKVRAGVFGPLDLALPALAVDTTDGYDPDLPAILRFIRGVLAAGRAGFGRTGTATS
jgi:predicted kinase